MHRAEDRLANKEIDDGTRQAQDDALKDLDQLIDLNENPPSSQDDQKNNSSDSSKSDSSKSGSSKSDPSKSASGSGSSGHSGSSGSSGRKSKGRSRGKKSQGHGNGGQGAGGTASGDKQQSGGKPDQKPGDPNGKSPNGGNGGGGKDSPPLKDRNADLYKDVWGHLPETLRAEMNAYSNTKGFMPEYDDAHQQVLPHHRRAGPAPGGLSHVDAPSVRVAGRAGPAGRGRRLPWPCPATTGRRPPTATPTRRCPTAPPPRA